MRHHASKVALTGAVLAALAPACGSPGTQCSCPVSTVTVDLPPDRAAALAQVQLTGAACPSAAPTCSAPAMGGCSQLVFQAAAAGRCQVDLLFSSGYPEYQASLLFTQVSCCPGYYADPPGSARLEVPAAALDGGIEG